MSSSGRPASALTAMVFPASCRTVVTGERAGNHELLQARAAGVVRCQCVQLEPGHLGVER